MKRIKDYIYNDLMKESRKLYASLGIVLILFLLFYGLLREFFFIPIMSKVWGLVLSTTPDGFISTSNIVNTIIKSPWIILAAIIMVIFYVFLAMWQISAILVGIGYAYQGKKIKVKDLFTISLNQISGRIRKENWMMLVYALVITPLASVYQAGDIIKRFVIPEYIQDFINSKTVLYIAFVILALAIIYVALRWLFIFPSFVLKKKDFKEAKIESDKLTEGNFFRNGISVVVYSIIDFIRLSIIPIIIILLPVFICYLCTSKLEFSISLFSGIGIGLGLELAKSITGTLVQISIMCYIVALYMAKLKEKNEPCEIELPPINGEGRETISINRLSIYASIASAIIIAAVYLVTVNIAQNDSSIILEIFGRTEIIAHKGYSSKAPENTMPAFDLADRSDSVNYIELDVWSTKDGVPVVIHNSSINDATGVDKEIYECTYDEIKDLPASYEMEKEDFPNAKIPTLEEVIKTYASTTPLLIEIKGFKKDPLLPKKIVELMKKYNCEYTSIIHSGDYRALEAVKKVDPDITCGLILAMVTGNYYDLPYADFYSVEHTFVDQNTVSLLHKRGKEIYAWTVNYDDSAERLKYSGVDGIITDVPDDINTYVGDMNNLVTSAFAMSESAQEEAAKSFASGEF